MAAGRLIAMLGALAEEGVDFIVVGDLAAALQGAPSTTLETGLVHARDAGNVARLLPLLESLDAVFRMQPERRIQPTAALLAGPGHLNLITRYGPLDLLGTIGRGLGYQDLAPHSTKMEIGGSLSVRVLDLETLIAIKEELGSEKDRAVLPILRRTLEEKKRRPPASGRK